MPRHGVLSCLLLALLPLLLAGVCVPGLPPGPGAPHGDFWLPALHAEPDPVEGGRIVDSLGREVLLRGVNVNAFVEYWAYDPSLFTTYPFTEADAALIAQQGWNVVRLLLSWSRVEPEPGVYDEAYLDRIAEAVGMLERHGVYTILDWHQDAWGASLAAAEDQICRPGREPAFGWDGAPAWATLGGDEERCFIGGTRELSPAVIRSFDLFWEDAPGPGGVGIRTRYVRMLGHVVARFASRDAIAGYDVMNEPNVIFTPNADSALPDFYSAALAEIRAAEASVGAPRRLVLLEPTILWAAFGTPLLQPFTDDDQIVYSPHIYQGGLSGTLSAAPFEQARQEAADIFGGAPVLSGEWGGDPDRAADPGDDYFELHQELQDRFRFGATLWTWREACGDPHKAGDVRAGRIPSVWGLFEVDCATNQVNGMRTALAAALLRPLVRAAPGPIDSVLWDPVTRHLEVRGSEATRGTSFIVFWPAEGGPPPRAETQGVHGVRFHPARGGHRFVIGFARGGPWQIVLEERPRPARCPETARGACAR